MLAIAPPRPREAAATRAGSCQCVVASTIAFARVCGSSDLKIPEPTNTPSAPSAIISAASAGVAIPPAQKSTTGSFPSRPPHDELKRRAKLLGRSRQLVSAERRERRISPVMRRMWRTASTMSPVPASPLERIIAAPSPIRRRASPRLVAPQTNGTLKAHLSMWLRLVGGREHLRLVDVVDLERLQHLRLQEVADPAPWPSRGC